MGKYSNKRVFQDVSSIPYGVNFRERIEKEVEKCAVFLAVIGRDWAEKIKDPNNFVRIEIEYAIKSGKDIVPVFVDGVKIPEKENLPKGIQELSDFNGISVRGGGDFSNDLNLLINTIDHFFQTKEIFRVEPLVRMFGACGSGAFLGGIIGWIFGIMIEKEVQYGLSYFDVNNKLEAVLFSGLAGLIVGVLSGTVIGLIFENPWAFYLAAFGCGIVLFVLGSVYGWLDWISVLAQKKSSYGLFVFWWIISWAIGGYLTSWVLRLVHDRFRTRQQFFITLAWFIGGIVGPSVGVLLCILIKGTIDVSIVGGFSGAIIGALGSGVIGWQILATENLY